jgi:hypothetical protein
LPDPLSPLPGHLERFARREAVTVRWIRTGGASIPAPVAPTISATTFEESA